MEEGSHACGRATRKHQKIIGDALGWLNVVESDAAARWGDQCAFAEEVRKAGFEFAVVLGMGGSSLCPEVLTRTFGNKEGYPAAFRSRLDGADGDSPPGAEDQAGNTLFIVSSKSGTTTEPQMFHRYFYERVKRIKGDAAGENFVAITDPGTQLVRDAAHNHFRRVFLNVPDIGGRYSALSYFGMVPFAVMGGDVKALLTRASTCGSCLCSAGWRRRRILGHDWEQYLVRWPTPDAIS